MTDEVMMGFDWIKSTLKGDATLMSLAPGGVYRAMAPETATTPFIVMSFQGGSDVVTANAFRLMDDLLFQVKVVGPASITNTLVQAANRLDALLGGPTRGTLSTGYILACYRQSPYQYDDLINAELTTYIGGLYRLEIQSTS